MNKKIYATILSACLISGIAIAADAPPAVMAVPTDAVAETIRTEATVVTIDQKTRVVSLKNAEGKIFDVAVSSAVKNLAQVKAGDIVVTEYTKALAIKLKKGAGIRSTTESTDAKRAASGEKPAGVVGREIDFVADVINVDVKTKTITLKGARGKIVDLKIDDPKIINEIKNGDQIEGTYVEALAIAVLPAKK